MMQRSRVVALVLCILMTWGTLSVVAGAEFEAPEPRERAEVEAVLSRAPGPPANDQLRQLHIVLWADVKDHGPGEHDYPLWQKRWALLLGGRAAAEGSVKQVNLFGPPAQARTEDIGAGAAKVEVTTAWKWPSDEQLASADLIVMQCYRSGGKTSRTWSQERIKKLEAYLARGGGLVLVHPATYTLRDASRPEHASLVALTGLVYDSSIIWRHGSMKLRVATDMHPICLGLTEVIELIDEPYWPPVGDVSAVSVLATSEESVPKGSGNSSPHPMFWTSRHGKGRVFACVPGHFTWTFDDPYFRILLLRGMAWAAGESPYRFDALVTRGIPLK